jgi:hypothetical protein
MQENNIGNLVFAVKQDGGFDVETPAGVVRVTLSRIGHERTQVCVSAPKCLKIIRHDVAKKAAS